MNKIELIVGKDEFHKLEQFVERLGDLSGIGSTYYGNIVSASGLVFELLNSSCNGMRLCVEATSSDNGLFLDFNCVSKDKETSVDDFEFAGIIGTDLFILESLSDLCVVDEAQNKLSLLFNTTAQFGIKAKRRANLLAGYLAGESQAANRLKC